MENTALNGTTTTTTKDQEDWKQKKGYTPLIVLTTVLLVLAFYAGQSRGSNVAGGTTRGATATASLTYSSTSSGKLVSPKELAKAWKEYDNGAYKDGCAIALGDCARRGPHRHLTNTTQLYLRPRDARMCDDRNGLLGPSRLLGRIYDA